MVVNHEGIYLKLSEILIPFNGGLSRGSSHDQAISYQFTEEYISEAIEYLVLSSNENIIISSNQTKIAIFCPLENGKNSSTPRQICYEGLKLA